MGREWTASQVLHGIISNERPASQKCDMKRILHCGPTNIGANGDLAPGICEALTLRQVPILNLIEIRNVLSD
jgi:hypothetical protein